ncbi:outer membrane protein assembly factor [Pelagibacterium lacus]|uniref:Outer membrane protein assembly factor n=1 Tax=Pelagibacterium lacus TaxID=2282655 RepID=A0A369W5Y0_9HYPH|nr:autotransporter assembly complex family protein [Pelagibacterium lacus]RDE09429.1 outer membrane protein assembly factor [Pelagibacterium lacus]
MAALLAASALAAPAQGFELFGIQFFGSEAEEAAEAVIADPRTYTLTFETGAEGELDGALRGASNLWGDRDAPASGVPGLLAKARGDYARLTGALYNLGYYGGAVSILVNGREAASLSPDASLPEPATIVVTVNPGPQFVFGRLAVANRAPGPVAPEDMVDAPEEIGFVSGQVARATIVAQAEQRLVQAWRQLGYPKAEIASRNVVADHRTTALDVTITVDPGAHAAIGPIGVEGTQNMSPAFIVRQTGLVAGAEYDPDDIELARERLTRLGVFRSLRIEAADAVPANGLLPYQIIVQEQALRRYGIGATLATIDGLGVEGYWLHRNLFGEAERLRLDAKVAGIGFPIDTAEFDYFFGGTFTKPGIYTPDTDLVAAISAERSVLPLYTETSLRGRIGIEQLFTDTISGGVGVQFQHSYFEDDATFGNRNFTTVGLYGQGVFDNRDSQLDPTEGFYVAATIDPLYELEYDNAIVRATLEGRTYFGFGEDDNFVLAARVRGGAIAGPSLSEIPPDLLFFAGGGGSVRGYGYRSIGVDDGTGTVTGGRYVLEGSLEGRVRFNDQFGAVAFVDGGYVAADRFPGLDELSLGAGIGLRYYTALGPLRLDAAIPLNKRPGDPDYALYVGIGQSF